MTAGIQEERELLYLVFEISLGCCSLLMYPWALQSPAPSESQGSDLHRIIWILAHIWSFPAPCHKHSPEGFWADVLCAAQSHMHHTPVLPLHPRFCLQSHSTPSPFRDLGMAMLRTEGNSFFHHSWALSSCLMLILQALFAPQPHQPSSPLPLLSPA